DTPLKGNIYLESANINAFFAVNDRQLQDQCRTWQDRAATLLYKGKIEPDETFFRFNLSAVHHEKARTLLCFSAGDNGRPLSSTKANAIQTRLHTALETLSSDLGVWKVYYMVTEARVHLAAHDIEASAQTAKSAMKLARAMHSKVEEDTIRSLYYQLDTKAPTNPYVRNLGVLLGVF
ncbi:MAG: hypothetical protein ACRDHW_22355, partial [Ktedonobacteraceae bacterium]